MHEIVRQHRPIRTAFSILMVATLSASAANAQSFSSNSTNRNGSRAGFGGSGTAAPGTVSGAMGYPIGTGTSATYGSGTVWGAGGTVTQSGVVAPGVGGTLGQFGYYNNAGIGFYSANPLLQQVPVYPAPVALGDNFYAFGSLSTRLGYWRSPSGYFYPWCPQVYLPGAVYPPSSPIYVFEQGAISAARPPVGLIINDMRAFIEDAKSKRQLNQSAYEHLFNSLNNLTGRAAELAAKNGGQMDSTDETGIRRDLDLLGTEITRSLNP